MIFIRGLEKVYPHNAKNHEEITTKCSNSGFQIQSLNKNSIYLMQLVINILYGRN